MDHNSTLFVAHSMLCPLNWECSLKDTLAKGERERSSFGAVSWFVVLREVPLPFKSGHRDSAALHDVVLLTRVPQPAPLSFHWAIVWEPIIHRVAYEMGLAFVDLPFMKCCPMILIYLDGWTEFRNRLNVQIRQETHREEEFSCRCCWSQRTLCASHLHIVSLLAVNNAIDRLCVVQNETIKVTYRSRWTCSYVGCI